MVRRNPPIIRGPKMAAALKLNASGAAAIVVLVELLKGFQRGSTMDQAALCAQIEEAVAANGAPVGLFPAAERIVLIVRDLLGRVPANAKVTLRDAAMQAFRNVCKLYDVPGLPEPFETMAEEAVARGLERVLNTLLGLEG